LRGLLEKAGLSAFIRRIELLKALQKQGFHSMAGYSPGKAGFVVCEAAFLIERPARKSRPLGFHTQN
jgi:hypothetical protein